MVILFYPQILEKFKFRGKCKNKIKTDKNNNNKDFFLEKKSNLKNKMVLEGSSNLESVLKRLYQQCKRKELMGRLNNP